MALFASRMILPRSGRKSTGSSRKATRSSASSATTIRLHARSAIGRTRTKTIRSRGVGRVTDCARHGSGRDARRAMKRIVACAATNTTPHRVITAGGGRPPTVTACSATIRRRRPAAPSATRTSSTSPRNRHRMISGCSRRVARPATRSTTHTAPRIRSTAPCGAPSVTNRLWDRSRNRRPRLKHAERVRHGVVVFWPSLARRRESAFPNPVDQFGLLQPRAEEHVEGRKGDEQNHERRHRAAAGAKGVHSVNESGARDLSCQ